MRRRNAFVTALAAVLGLAALTDVPARAEDPESPVATAEREALELYGAGKVLTARTKAEAILAQDPSSIIGHYVLGSALRDAEGSLPRALSQLREAKQLFETRYPEALQGADATPGAAHKSALPDGLAELHRELLRGVESTAGLMELNEEQLAILDEYDSLYTPPMLGQHAWPLMKLHRFEEARSYAHLALQSKSAYTISLGLNGLCAIEAEAHDRQASYESCLAGLDQARKRQADAQKAGAANVPNLAVHAHNAALGALSVFRHAEAEKLALEGTQRLESTVANPWRSLVELYLVEGRAGDAVGAIREMQKWFAHQPAEARDQKGAENDAVTATLLLVAGESEAGLRFIGRALERPDRQGTSSSQPLQSLGGHAVIRRAMLHLDAQLAAERAAADPLPRRVLDAVTGLAGRTLVLPDDERLVNVLSDDAMLVTTIRTYLDGGLENVPTWLTGDLVHVLGAGVMAVALAEARHDEKMPEAVPYFDALDAEIALARRDLTGASFFAAQALEKLPPAEALLRARVAALGAEAARRRGDTAGSVALLQRVLELDPGTIRRLGYAIPAAVRLGGGGEAAERAAAILRRSPRLTEADDGFVVRIQAPADAVGASLEACLVAPLGATLSCARVDANPGEAAEALGTRLAAEFHRVAFALRLPITDADVRSLDGSTTITRDAVRERLRNILEDTTGTKE